MPGDHVLFPNASDAEIERRFSKDRLSIDVIRECFGKTALHRALYIEPVIQPESSEEQGDAA